MDVLGTADCVLNSGAWLRSCPSHRLRLLRQRLGQGGGAHARRGHLRAGLRPLRSHLAKRRLLCELAAGHPNPSASRCLGRRHSSVPRSNSESIESIERPGGAPGTPCWLAEPRREGARPPKEPCATTAGPRRLHRGLHGHVPFQHQGLGQRFDECKVDSNRNRR